MDDLLCRRFSMENSACHAKVENNLLKLSTKLLESPLASYEKSSLVSLKSSLLDTKTSSNNVQTNTNLVGLSIRETLVSKHMAPLSGVGENSALKNVAPLSGIGENSALKHMAPVSGISECSAPKHMAPLSGTGETHDCKAKTTHAGQAKTTHAGQKVFKQKLPKVRRISKESKEKMKKVKRKGEDENLNRGDTYLLKKKKVTNEISDEVDMDISDTTFVIPNYDLEKNFKPEIPEFPKFLPPEKDHQILRSRIFAADTLQPKRELLNASSASLIYSPNFKKIDDPVRLELIRIADSVTSYDPEFVLKVALYTRCELNIRTTANFLLAYAANRLPCRPFLQKYFKSAINLPSDWTEVAEICQIFNDRTVSIGSLPQALRKAMVAKFPDFDKYQLSKYNKENSAKKKKKKMKQTGKSKNAKGTTENLPNKEDGKAKKMNKNQKTVVGGQEVKETSESFTLKQLIRKLHIAEPVEHVMCLIGKKYPSTFEEFYQSRLPGTFEEEKAGKRMKIPMAVTWETQVSLKGNKASTWEDLIDQKKLPFMAMLRNLRNMIKAGISEKHHSWVINKLSDEGAVTHSKQFPFRFFSAYEVLEDLEKQLKEKEEKEEEQSSEPPSGPETMLLDIGGERVEVAFPDEAGKENASGVIRGGRGRGRGGRIGRGGRGGRPQARTAVPTGSVSGRGGRGGRGRGGRGGRGGGGGKGGLKKAAKTKPIGICYDVPLLTRYRKALDSAVKVATVHNVKPIKGKTVIFCGLWTSMATTPCSSAKGLGKPRTLAEIAVLLGLMCKYSCENCQFIVVGSDKTQTVELEKGTILHNMDRVLKLVEIVNAPNRYGNFSTSDKGWNEASCFIDEYITNLLIDRVQVNNIIVLMDTISVTDSPWQKIIKSVEKYRMIVDKELLFVGVNLGMPQSGLCAERQSTHENDIFISGFSDQLLRFIAERGESGQLIHVEKIDEAYSLKPLPKNIQTKPSGQAAVALPEKPLPLVNLIPRWRMIRVFISSTFCDMHGERDLLTRFVFPELRSRAEKRFINVHEVDLRWGITEYDARSKRTLALCLREVSNCQLFVGILGERYGWIPTSEDIPDDPEFEWILENIGCSVTELEMYSAALCNPSLAAEKAFFYIRDNTFEKDVPRHLQLDFASEDKASAEKLGQLKDAIRTSGLEVYDGYPCCWGGVVGDKPVVAGLEQFGARVLLNLWNAIEKQYPQDDNFLDETTHENAQHENFFDALRSRMVGRKILLNKSYEMLKKSPSGLVVVYGKAGSGKSSVMANLAHKCIEAKLVDSGLDLLVHCVGAAPGSTNIVSLLRRLCNELGRRLNVTAEVPSHFKNLVDRFQELLKETSKAQSGFGPLMLFLDGLDLLENVHDALSLNWLPETIPQNIFIVVSVREDSACQTSLFRRKDIRTKICIDLLDAFDKAEVVRQILSSHAKRLDESLFNNQLKILMSKRESGMPLYLSLACEEVRVFGLFEKVTQKLHSLPHTVAQLLNEALLRIESDNGTRVVALSLSLLFCSRNGLDEDELISLLSLDQLLNGVYTTVDDIRNVHLSHEHKISSVTTLRLIRSLETFLRPIETSRSTVLKLQQLHMRTIVQQRYLKGPNAMQESTLHRLLAGYYYTVADPERNGSWMGKNPKAFSELPYHLACSGSYGELSKVLCDLFFIYTKCRLGLAVATLNDFSPPSASTTYLEKERTKLLSDQRFVDFQNFLSRNLHILSSYPILTIQQALNEPDQAHPTIDAERILNDKRATEAGLMKWCNKEMDCCLRTMDDLPDVVTCMTLSKDGALLAVAFRDCTVKLYRIESPALTKELKMFCGHSNFVSGLCFVTNSRLCTASADGTLSLWSTDGGYRIAVLKGHTRQVASCASDPSGKVIVSVGWDFAIKLWNGQTGQLAGNLAIDQRPVNCIAFHPEGQLIVTGDWDSTLKLWDVFHKSRKGILRGHHSSVRDVTFSPSGRHIVSASLDGEIKIWSSTHGSNVGVIHGHSLPINRLAFSPTGQELVTVSDDKKVKMWSGNIGQQLHCIGQNERHGRVICVAFDATGDHMAAGYHEGVVRVFEAGSDFTKWEKSLFSDPVSVQCIKYKSVEELDISTGNKSVSTAALFIGTANGSILMLDKNTGEVKCTLMGNTKSVMTLDVCKKSDSGYIASAGEDFVCRLYEYSEMQKNKHVMPVHKLEGHTGPVTCCAFNMDDTKLATGSRDRNVIIWDLQTAGQVIQERVLYSCHNDWVTCCAWSNTGNFLVTGSNDFNLKLWDVKSGSEKVKFTGHLSAISSVAYSYGCIVSCSNDGLVKIWSHKGAEVTTLYGHTQKANSCDIYVHIQKEPELVDSTDWATMVEEEEWRTKHEESKVTKTDVKVERIVVASCSDDGTIRLWLPTESSELATLTGHSDKVVALSCGQSGFICTAGLDKTLKLWKATERVTPASGHVGEVTAVTVSEDGYTLCTVSRDGAMKIWCRLLYSEDMDIMLDVPQLLLTVQVSKKAVNCVKFVDRGDDYVLVGSDDNTVALWHVSLYPPQARKLASVTTSSPVSSFADPQLSSSSLHRIVATQLNMTVSLISIKDIYSQDLSMQIFEDCITDTHTDWCLSSACAVIGSSTTVMTGGADGRVVVWKNKPEMQSKKKFMEYFDVSQILKPESQSSDAWITCIDMLKYMAYSGDSSGCLTCWSRESSTGYYGKQSQTQIHAGKLTTIVHVDDLIFTGSAEKTIKVWNTSLKQLGQFFCNAPVTCLAVTPDELDVKKYHLDCGNDLGEVLFLIWQS